MVGLNYYLVDGAGTAARVVLMILQGLGEIEESWSDERKRYEAEINVARWENCREQGYVVMLRNKKNQQLNIAFFEHRNSDSICAVKWQQNTMNSPTIDTAKFEDVYKDKYDLSFTVGYGEYGKMAEWIFEQLQKFWKDKQPEA